MGPIRHCGHSYKAKKNALKSALGGAALVIIFSLVLVLAGEVRAASTLNLIDDATGGGCSSVGNWDAVSKTCTLTTDLTFTASNGILISSSGIVLDGAGHSISGDNTSYGVDVEGLSSVTVRNLTISNFSYGVYLNSSSGTTVTANTITNNATDGIFLNSSSSNAITQNTVSGSGVVGIDLAGLSDGNTIYHNNFLLNAVQARDTSGATGNSFNQASPAGGNYWSDWTSPDVDGNGFVDSPYTFSGGSDGLPFTTQNGWVDSIAPTVSNVLPSGTIYTASTTISASYTDPGLHASGINPSSVSVSLDGNTLAGCTVSASAVSCPVASIDYGPHVIGGGVSDNSGNTTALVGSFSVGDNIPPTVSSVSPSGTISVDATTINVYYSDAAPSIGINTAAISVTLDGSALTSCTITATNASCPVSGLALGSHVIGGSVADNAGNTAPVSGSFTVADSVAPTITGVAPSGTISTDSTTISVDYTDPAPTSGINTAAVSVTLDGSALTGCMVTATSASCPVSGLALGNHSIGGSVADNAGNAAPINGSFSVGDTVAPTITSVLPSGSISTASATVAVYYSDPLPSSGINTATVTVSLDGVTLSGCTINTSSASCPVTGLLVGTHAIGGSVADNAGNTTPVSGSFDVVDSRAPLVTSVLPAGNISSDSATIAVYYRDPVPATGINTSSVVVTLDGTALSSCTVTADIATCPVSGLAVGTHAIGGSVADNAGNTTTISGGFTVGDSTPPLVTNVSPSGSVSAGPLVISVDYQDPAPASGINPSTVVVTLDGSPLSGCSITNTNASCSLSSVSIASHTIGGSVSDYAGNIAPISGSFTAADTAGPTITSVLPNGIITTGNATIVVYYSDPAPSSGINTAAVSVTLDGTTLTGCTVTETSARCPVTGLSLGIHNIGGSVVDNAGNSSVINGSFGVEDAVAPTVTSVQPSGTISTDSAVIRVYYSDPDPSSGINTSAVTVTLDGTTLSGCSVTVTDAACPVSGLAIGTHVIGGSVADNTGNATQISGSFSTTETVPPTITAVLPSGTINTASATISVYYSDPAPSSGINTAAVSVTLDGATLPGCTVTATNATCQASGLAVGGHTIGGSVSDNAGNTSTISGSFAVADATPPIISNITPAGSINTSAATVTADYFDPAPSTGINTASVSVYLDGTPLAGCLVTGSGVSCPASGLALGTHTINVSARDLSGNAGSASGTFEVVDTIKPQVTSVAPTGHSELAPAAIDVYYTDPVGSGTNPAPASGINTAQVFISLDGTDLTGCTISAAKASCPVPAGIAAGPHLIGGSVADLSGNVNFVYGVFSVGAYTDNTPPIIGFSMPSGSTTFEVDYADNAGGSGIYTQSVRVLVDGNVITSTCTVDSTHAVCPAPDTATSHTVKAMVSDNAGNIAQAVAGYNVNDTAFPIVSNVLPSGNITLDTATISASFTDPDPSSGINMASISVTLDGTALTGCLVTADAVSCPVSGLSLGTHTIGGSVSDYASHTSYINGSFTVQDTLAPVVTNVQPSGSVNPGKITVSADYNDPSDATHFASGIDTSTVNLKLDGTSLTGCSVTTSSASCVVYNVNGSSHTISGSVADHAGNATPISGSFMTIDTVPPKITSISPSGTVRSAAQVYVMYTDAGSGVNAASVRVYLDGNQLTCNITTSSATCPISNPPEGLHNISGFIADNAGNQGHIIGSFMLVPAMNTVAPHGGYSATTNSCNLCHEMHDSKGDYALSRESTETAVCGTCHGLFGTAVGKDTWTQPPPTYDNPNLSSATASQYPAYTVDMSQMNASEMDAVPGHSLGVMENGTVVRNSDDIPGGISKLKIMTSGQPNGYPDESAGWPLYDGEPATAFNTLKGLSCSSCHTPHGSMDPTDTNGDGIPDNSVGQQFTDLTGFQQVTAAMLLSSRPNHSSTAVTSMNAFCIACHDQPGIDGNSVHTDHPVDSTHPAICTSCHWNPSNGSSADFPHTSVSPELVTAEGNDLCAQCHDPATLP